MERVTTTHAAAATHTHAHIPTARTSNKQRLLRTPGVACSDSGAHDGGRRRRATRRSLGGGGGGLGGAAAVEGDGGATRTGRSGGRHPIAKSRDLRTSEKVAGGQDAGATEPPAGWGGQGGFAAGFASAPCCFDVVVQRAR